MPKLFDIKPQVLKTPEQAYAELLGDSSENQIVDLNVDLIDEIENQRYKIRESKIAEIAESMKIVGQIDPVQVIPNPKKKGRYLLLAGRHRRRACILNGEKTVKAVIKKEKNPDKQRLMLLVSNNNRNNDYDPSELAFSYLEQMQLLEKLGSKSTASKIAEENNTNRKTVHKYIQLTKLIPPLLSRVDSNILTVGAGYELSFLTPEQQTSVINFILNHSDCHITKENARIIRENPDKLENIFFPDVSEEESETNSNDNSETLKTEKKINSALSETKKCPSKGQLVLKIRFEVLMTIAYIIKKETYSIFSYIISSYPTTDEVVELINRKYVQNNMSFEGVLDEGEHQPFYTYLYSEYSIQFKNKLIVKFVTDTHEKETYRITYKELDDAIRKFLRKYVSAEDKILAIKESEH